MKKIIWILLIGFINTVYATDFEQTYQAAGQLGNTLRQTPAEAINTFNPQNIFEHFEPNPSQSQYYQGEKAASSDLKAKAAEFALNKNNEQSQTVLQSFGERPLYEANFKEPGLQQSQLITQHAANIVKGISDQFVDCKKTQDCKTTYTQQTCSAAGGIGDVSCTRDLIVNAIPALPVKQIVTVDVSGIAWDKKSATAQFKVDLRTGQLVGGYGMNLRASVMPLLTSIPCDNFTASYTVESQKDSTVTMEALPSCQNQFQTTFTVRSKGYLTFNVAARLLIQVSGKSPDVLTEIWTSTCDGLEQRTAQGRCQRIKPAQCTSPGETRMINSVPVSRPCWQTTEEYHCKATTTETCQPLQAQGCEQIGSVCKDKTGSECTRYEQTYRCPKQQCTGGTGIVCGSETFCLEGDCTKPQKTPNLDFEKAVSALSGAADASKQFDSRFIFKGQAKSCRSDMLNFRNCCADPGWGEDLHLASCDEDEKKLYHDKEAKLTIEVGEYCANDILGFCLEHKKAYCVFSSKLARIIQQQGRQGQLGMGFGEGEQPNCQGLTPEQLQQLDFSKIDFSEFYDDLKRNMTLPDIGATNERLKATIQRHYEQGKSHG